MEKGNKDVGLLDATVIILGYNGRRYIDGCLGSVLEQDYPVQRYEVIWADNNSTDGSADYVAQQFGAVRVLRFDRNYGFAMGNNRVAKEARGRYLVFLNQDTIVHRNWLRALVETMDADPGLGACQANMLMPWAPGFDTLDRQGYPDLVHFAEISRYGFVEYRDAPMQDDPIQTVFVSGASLIVRRNITEQMPYIFDPLFVTYSEDLDFSLRLGALGYRAAVAPRAVIYHLQYSQVSNLCASFTKAYMSTRNRFVAHYKTMPLEQFAAFLPTLLVGSFLKVRQFRFKQAQEILLMGVMLVVCPAALVGTLMLGPKCRRQSAGLIS
jgi:GT2 family glycosyltransferase